MADDKPTSRRPTASERRAAQRTRRPSDNPFQTRTAAQRRAQRAVVTRGGTVRPINDADDMPRRAPAKTVATASEQLTQETIAHLLEHPTKQVSEGELRAEYSYVLRDVRSMFVLAAALVVVLVALALVLPR